MKLLEVIVGGLVIGASYFCAHRNVDVTKAHAEQVWKNSGYRIVGYEGYQMNLTHGGAVWYIVKETNNSSITYHGALCKWGNEYHIYNLSALNAIGAK